MPRISGTNVNDGAATTGRAYEPAVTPQARDDDDTRVIGNRNAGRDSYTAGQYGPDSEASEGTGQGRQSRQGDVYNQGGLQPTYEVIDRDNEERDGDKRRRDRDDDRDEYRCERHDDDRYRFRDHARATSDNPFGDHDPTQRHPWQPGYAGNAGRPYGADRYEDEGRSSNWDRNQRERGRSDAEREHDDRARYADDRRREQSREGGHDSGRDDIRSDGDFERGRDASRYRDER